LKKLSSHKQFAVGKVYNRVYVGDNDAYAKINGKETFIVIATSPELQTQTLFDQFGSAFSDELRGGVVTFGSPEVAFADFEIYEVEDKSEWFIKSRYMTCKEALESGLLFPSEIRSKPSSHWSGSKTFQVCTYNVEDRCSDNPFLQCIVVKWESYAAMKSDFELYGATATE